MANVSDFLLNYFLRETETINTERKKSKLYQPGLGKLAIDFLCKRPELFHGMVMPYTHPKGVLRAQRRPRPASSRQSVTASTYLEFCHDFVSFFLLLLVL